MCLTARCPVTVPSVDKTTRSTLSSRNLAQESMCRAVFVNFEPVVVEQVRTGTYQQLSLQLFSGKENARRQFARGHHTIGKRQTADLLRPHKEAEKLHRQEGLLVCFACGGGTGSGLGSASRCRFVRKSRRPWLCRTQCSLVRARFAGTHLVYCCDGQRDFVRRLPPVTWTFER